MEFYDIVKFDCSELDYPLYEFSHVYQLKYLEKFIFIGNPDLAIKNLRKFQIFYINNYEISIELFAKAKEQKKAFLISISDILKSKTPFYQMYRIERFVRVARHYDLNIICASLAEDEYMIRSPDESGYILSKCGFTRQQVFYSYSLLKKILEMV